MIDFVKVRNIIETNRFENQQTSYPFIVKSKNGKLVISWFIYDVVGYDRDHLFTHIMTIFVVDEELSLIKKDVSLDVPFAIQQKSALMKYDDYCNELSRIYSNFSEEEMNHFLQDNAYKPLFKAFQCVRTYVRMYN